MDTAVSKTSGHILSRKGFMIAAALLCCFLWGSAFVSIPVGYRLLSLDTEDIFQISLFAGTRFFIASMMIFAYAFFTGKSMRIDLGQLGKVAVLGLMQTFGQYVFFFLSLRTIHPANGAILSSMGVFFTIILAHFIYKSDRLTPKKTMGLFIGLTGIFILNGGTGGGFSLTGEGFMMTSSLIGAISGLYTKRIAKSLSPYVITGYQLLLGSILLMSLGAAFAQDVQFSITLFSGSIVLYLSFISAMAFTLWSGLLKHNPVSRISIYKFSIPLFGVFLSFVFLREGLDLGPVFFALLFVAAGIIMIDLETHAKGEHPAKKDLRPKQAHG